MTQNRNSEDFLFPLLSFQGCTLSTWRFPGYMSNWSYSHQPMPQPQQLRIPAHDSTRFPTHWARPGIKPMSSWLLVGFINHWAMMATPRRFSIVLNPDEKSYYIKSYTYVYIYRYDIYMTIYIYYTILSSITHVVYALNVLNLILNVLNH